MQLNKLLTLAASVFDPKEQTSDVKYSSSLRKLLTAESSDHQLYELATKLYLRLEPIVFVDELNKLPKPTEKRNYNYIINLRDPAHWVGLMIDNRNHRAYYFNSFANEFGGTPAEIIDFVKRCNAILYETDQPIQDPNRGFCGQYTILWLSYMNRENTIENGILKPSNDLQDFNDYLDLFRDMTSNILRYKKNNPDLPY